jgi:hypothetical protein
VETSAVRRSPKSPSRVNVDCFAKGKSGNDDEVEVSGLISHSIFFKFDFVAYNDF